MPKLLKSKTVWTAVITGIVGLGCFLTGKADVVDLVQIESVCAMIAFLRHGVVKAEI